MSANAIVVQQHTVSDIERIARNIAASKLFGVATAEQAITLCLVAQAEGRHPASAAQDYHIIQGRPAKKSDAMLRDFLNSGGKVEWHRIDDEVADATFSHPAGGSARITWDMDRALKAELFFVENGKKMRNGRNGPEICMWEKYPRQMLRARVVSEGVRTVFPMATSGMYVPEEVVEFAPQQPTAQPDAAYTTVEGSVLPLPENPEALPKAKTRETYAALQQEIDACSTLDELAALWVSKSFQSEFKKLKADWQSLLTQQKDALKDWLEGNGEPQDLIDLKERCGDFAERGK